MRRTHLVLVLPALLLGACGQQSTPRPAATAPIHTSPTVPGSGEQPAPPRPALQSLGTVDIQFSGISDGAQDLKVSAVAVPQVGSSALSDRGSIQLKPLSNGTFTTGVRGVNGVRYLYATFLVRNADASGTAYSTARQNLTLVAASTANTVGNTPFSRLLRFDGTAAAPEIAPTIVPTTGLQFSRQTELPALLPGAQDLQVFAEDEVSSLTGVTRAFPYGYVVRHRTLTNTRALAASPAADTFDGVVTVAIKLPLQATVADDPYTFNMSFAVVDDSVTRVTESLEEQTLGTAQTRASALGSGTQVAVLCGSTSATANTLFIGSVTTAGATGSRSAHIGGDVALKSLPTAYAATGNVKLSVNAASGLAKFYSAYPSAPGGAAATPAFSGNSSARSGAVAVAGDGSFTFTSAAGDGNPAVTDTLNYAVSDGRGCVSPVARVPVGVSGRVWFARNTATSGDGRQDTPFPTLAAAQNAATTGETLYLYRGDGTTAKQNTGLTLKAGQTLIGEGAPLTVGGVTALPAGTQESALENTAGSGLILSTGNTVSGVRIKGTTAGISGTNFGTFTATLPAVQATSGPALDLSSGTLAASVTRLDASNPSGNGVNLVGVGGSLSVVGSGTAGSGGVVQTSTTGTVPPVGFSLQTGNQNLNLSLDRMTVQNNSTGLLHSPQASATGGLTLTVKNSTFTNNIQNAVQLNPTGTASNSYTITDNTVTQTDTGGGITYANGARQASAVDQGRIQRNTLSLSSTGNANAITVDQVGPGTARFDISNNTVTSYGVYGLEIGAKDGAGRLDAIVTGNRISSPPGSADIPNLDGMALLSGTSANQGAVLCVKATGNTSVAGDAANYSGLVLRRRAGNTFTVDGLSGTTAAQAQAYLQAQNNNSTVRFRNISDFSATTGTCTGPS